MSATIYYTQFESPVGLITLEGDGRHLTGLFMPNHKCWNGLDATHERNEKPFAAVLEQLAEYFTGDRQTFDLSLKLAGTPFQQQVWKELVKIPFGKTIHYGELAKRVGNPAASRAVGNANGKNPISIIVPCHRVIGSTGKLTGYGGGIHNKEWLLDWERGVKNPKSGELFARAAST